MNRRTCMITAAVLSAVPAVAWAHYSQRVWADIDNNSQLMPVVGPPGNAPFNYSASMFFYDRVYARDFGSQCDVNYTSLLGGPLWSDGDLSDEGVNYESDFPGYEDTPYPTRTFPAFTTYNVSIAGAPLYYLAANGSSPAHFASVASVYAGQTLPYFSISNVYVGPNGNEVAYDDSNGNGTPVPAFTTGSHGHPDFVLHPNPEDDDYNGPGDDVTDSDQYDGVYAVPLQLSGPGVTNSPVFYEVIGKNESLSEIAAAGVVAENTLVPPVTSTWNLVSSGSWGANANWSAAIPFYTGDTAVFASNSGAASAVTVTLDGNYSVGHLLFNSSTTSFTIAQGSGGMLSIGADNGADITVLNGQHFVTAPIAFAVALGVNTSTGASITLSGGLSFPPAASYPYAATLTKTGPGTLDLTGTISAGYASSFIATGGNTFIGTNPTAGLSLSAIGIGTAITFPANASGGIQSLSAGSLNISSGALVKLQSTPSHATRSVLDVTGLSIDSVSQLDLGNNDLIIQNPDAQTAQATLASVTVSLRQGFNGGSWQGAAGIFSSAAAADPTHLTAIGSIINDNGSGSPIYSNFDGVSDSNPDTDVLLKYTYYGDANLDGQVDGSDYSRIDNGYLNHLTGWFNGDFNYDGVINGSDYTLIDNAFNRQGASLAAVITTPTDQIAAVPEPTVLILIPALMLLGRNRRTRLGGKEAAMPPH